MWYILFSTARSLERSLAKAPPYCADARDLGAKNWKTDVRCESRGHVPGSRCTDSSRTTSKNKVPLKHVPLYHHAAVVRFPNNYSALAQTHNRHPENVSAGERNGSRNVICFTCANCRSTFLFPLPDPRKTDDRHLSASCSFTFA